MTNQDYGKLVNEHSKPSPFWKNLLWAFLVGGSICTIGQGLLNMYKSWGLDKEQAGTAVSVTLIFAAALLTGLGYFDKLAKFAGAGTLVPITGFA
ncbi:MAG: SpoVA/SpoVAEb family sporulation membrane protein, partial [Lawsonibacter sp.]|nr:SpoVA/SpoVAEb family sporulation membrane protein [Lawsonibacter sp.]